MIKAIVLTLLLQIVFSGTVYRVVHVATGESIEILFQQNWQRFKDWL